MLCEHAVISVLALCEQLAEMQRVACAQMGRRFIIMGKKKYSISADQAYRRMVQTCSRKECCVYDIQKKLSRMELSDEVQDEIIKKLKEGRYIDEDRFIRSFINDKLQFNKWGRKKIELALFQKRLPRESIDRIFMEYPEADLSHALPELLEKKWPSITGKSLYEKRSS